jgi:hypothetical protein
MTSFLTTIARTQKPNGATALKKASRTSGRHLLNLNSGLILSLVANAAIAASVGAASDRSKGNERRCENRARTLAHLEACITGLINKNKHSTLIT